jgi:hypothetical protein
MTELVKSVTHFVENKGVLAKGVADGCRDDAPKPGSVTDQPTWRSKTGTPVKNLEICLPNRDKVKAGVKISRLGLEMTRRNQHQYFLTTHSNHLLDMSSEFKEMSVYLFSKEFKEEKTRFKVSQALSPDSNILKELGVHNSSVFLTNATIWVEGVTDRLYLRAYLNKYSEQVLQTLREDYHYLFVE